MSYSFNIRAANKADAEAAVASELDKVVAQQPVHEADRAQALATARAMLEIIPEPGEGENLSVNVSGWVQWRGVMGGEDPVTLTGANVSVSASIVPETA